MLKFSGISRSGEMVIKGVLGPGGDNKWAKHQREVFSSSDSPKLQASQRHIFAACLNNLIILETGSNKEKSLTVLDFDFADKNEYKIQSHISPITCFAVDEGSLLVCSCSDEHVFLSKWDSMLGHWDTKGISEGDGRILSCSIAFMGLEIYVVLFKSDTLIIYKVISGHTPMEPGPLILESIECFSTVEKVKELTSWSRSLFFKNNFNVIGVASGNTVALKLWEVSVDEDQICIKLKSHRLISCLKNIAGADLIVENDIMFVMIVGNDGTSEVFHLATDVFNLLYRFKVEDCKDMCLNGVQDQLNTSITQSSVQVEYRVLCARFFRINFPTSPQQSGNVSDPTVDIGGGGDATSEVQTTTKSPLIDKGEVIRTVTNMYPKLLVAAGTTKGIVIFDVVGGRSEMAISYDTLLNDDSIFTQNAHVAVNADAKEIVIALQSCLTRTILTRTFLVTVPPPVDPGHSSASLISCEALSSKSVLRKKIKSPPRQPVSYPMYNTSHGKASAGHLRSQGTQPSWARARSRPLLKSSTNKHKVPMSARSRAPGSLESKRGAASSDTESLPANITNITSTGTYETDTIPFQECKKVTLPSSMTQGISVVRIAATMSGKHIALGGNLSPLVILKTKPCQTYRLFKNLGKVTSVHFNFGGNFLLVASSDCRTTVVDWKNTKEVISFDFSTKFNEHVHSQFYFMDKFILQPEENRIVLYSYAKRESGYIKLKAGEFQLCGQSITALAAVNQFYSNIIVAGLSNKSLQIFDTNAEKISVQISNTHSKPVSCIRINEAPKGPYASTLCDVLLTTSFSSWDPIKLWDIRSAKCMMTISDVNQSAFIPTVRPNISPCGRYIASGFEDGSMIFYDVRRLNSRLHTIKKVGSTVLDCSYDVSRPMVWSACRNGSIINFHSP